MRLSLPVFLVFVFLPVFARADSFTTYTYTGNYFNQVNGPYTTADRLTGFVTAGTLDNNLMYGAPLDVYAYSFTDGVQTLTGSYAIIGTVATDSTGNIVEWFFQAGPLGHGCLSQGGSLVGSNAGDQCESQFDQAFGQILHAGGTWTMITTPTPEPSSVALLGTGIGLLALAGIARRRPRPTCPIL
jgi:hypothetical protein